MATIRAFTTIEQSRKLAEILPLESADMHYHYDNDFHELESIPTITEEDDHFILFPEDVRCWSLAALLSVLESEIDGEEGETYQLNIEKDGTWWNVWYREQYDEANPIETESTEELVDACYELILKLNELNLL